MSRHHTEPNNILLTRNLPFCSDVRHWSHLLLIPLHCLWAKSNNRTHGQFECDATWFCFCFDFVRSRALCGLCSIVCLRFQVVQIKQVDCKMSNKNVNNYKQKTFRDIFGKLHTQEHKATKWLSPFRYHVTKHVFLTWMFFTPLWRTIINSVKKAN